MLHYQREKTNGMKRFWLKQKLISPNYMGNAR